MATDDKAKPMPTLQNKSVLCPTRVIGSHPILLRSHPIFGSRSPGNPIPHPLQACYGTHGVFGAYGEASSEAKTLESCMSEPSVPNRIDIGTGISLSGFERDLNHLRVFEGHIPRRSACPLFTEPEPAVPITPGKEAQNHTNSRVSVLARLLPVDKTMKTYATGHIHSGGGDESNNNTAMNVLTVRGIVIPAEWDERGNVVAVAVSAYNEEEYLIDRRGKGEELQSLIRRQVEVTGVVTGRRKRKTITVEDYSLHS